MEESEPLLEGRDDGGKEEIDESCAYIENDLKNLKQEKKPVSLPLFHGAGGAPGGAETDASSEQRDCQDQYLSLRCLAHMYDWRRNATELFFRNAGGGRLDPLDGIRAIAFIWVSTLHMLDMLKMVAYNDDTIITTGSRDGGDDDRENSYLLQGTRSIIDEGEVCADTHVC